MKKILHSLVIATVGLLFHSDINAQARTNLDTAKSRIENGRIGITIPVIYNNSKGVYYTSGNRREPTGNAISYGININYSHFLYKNLYIIGGVGLYAQNFDIQRPFQYKTPDGTEPLVSTKKYTYQNIQFLIGVGCEKMISDKWSLGGQLSYNIYSSYRQKYEQEYFPGKNEVYKNRLMLGSTVNLDLRCERYLNNRFSIGAAIIFPVYTHWNDDKIFNKYDYADDTQIIAYPKFSLGANLSVYCQLKNKRL
ncbi:MAG: hypothetical protein LC122_06205 [Chitinophagales bacterium]|nr:hypothetical protein [Chitinophagales bacterium]